MTELDLTPDDPRSGSDKSGGSKRNVIVVMAVALVLGFVLVKAVTSASVYFYNVDEAVAQRSEIGDRTFRLQGTVSSDPEINADGLLTFQVTYNQVDVMVHHVGAEPTDLFEFGIPVVAEGHWEGDVFESGQLLIKHSESYVADNPTRIDEEVESRIDSSQ